MFAEAPESAPVIQGRDLKQELAVEGGGGYAPQSTSCATLLSAASTLLSTATAILSAGTSPQYYPPQQYAHTPVPAP